MTVNDLVKQTGWKILTQNADREITSAYVCDLLSWAMAHGRAGTAWITVQSHINVMAVASLLSFSCVIVSDNITVSAETMDAAVQKGVCILSAPCSSYGVAAALIGLGIGEV